jgi:hypothetical protein
MELDQEILQDFGTESKGLLDELETVVEALEDHGGTTFPTEKLKEFSQKIDRIMGAAKTLLTMAPGHPGISYLARVSEMCKTMGYQAAALQRAPLIPIFAGFWAETIESMRDVLTEFDEGSDGRSVVEESSTRLQGRLGWLAEKVAPHSEDEKKKVIEMLKKL